MNGLSSTFFRFDKPPLHPERDVPVAVFGVALLHLKIAQPFMAGMLAHSHLPKSRQGRKVFADGHHIFLPSRWDFYISLTPDPAMNGWAMVTASVRDFADFASLA